MITATIVPAPDGPLSQEQRSELALANERAKKIRKAAGVAAFNGWATGIFAALSVPFALFSFSLDGLFVTVGLSAIAFNEFRGRKRLLRFDPSAPILLGWNQIGFMSLIVVYCLWMIFDGLTGQSQFVVEMQKNPELASFNLDEAIKALTVIVYGTVIVLSLVFQGMNSLYYFTRRKYVEAYVQETPKWVLDLQHIMAPG